MGVSSASSSRKEDDTETWDDSSSQRAVVNCNSNDYFLARRGKRRVLQRFDESLIEILEKSQITSY